MGTVVSMAEAIRGIRKAEGLSQKEFGEAVGVGQQAVSHWENNRREPEPEQRDRIEEEFGVALPSSPNGRPMRINKLRFRCTDFLVTRLRDKADPAEDAEFDAQWRRMLARIGIIPSEWDDWEDYVESVVPYTINGLRFLYVPDGTVTMIILEGNLSQVGELFLSLLQ